MRTFLWFGTDLLTYSLPAILALNGMLDHRIVRSPAIYHSNDIKRQSYSKKIEDLVNESPVGHDDGAIVLRPFDCIIAIFNAVVRAAFQDGEFLIEILGDEWKEGEDRGDDVRNERFDYGREGSCYSSREECLVVAERVSRKRCVSIMR